MARKKKPETRVVLAKSVKSLRQEHHTWEADFRAFPKPLMQSETHYLGLVVKEDGSVLARSQVEGRPTADDLATLLTAAVKRPLLGQARRPHRLHLRGHRQWQKVFPHLEELGIDVSVQRKLPKVEAAHMDHLRQLREAHRAALVKPTPDQSQVETMFPAVAKWVSGYGHIEIGDQEGFGFVVRAIDYGGVVFEDDTPKTLAEAMAALEEGLAVWFEEQEE